MNIYLAASYKHYPLMQEVADLLAQHGHAVTSRWIQGANVSFDGDLFAPDVLPRSRQWAQDDVDDLTDADVFLGFSEPGVLMRGGKAVELGMALALRKRSIVIAGHEHIFHALPQVEHVPDIAAAIALLAQGRDNTAAIAWADDWYKTPPWPCANPECLNQADSPTGFCSPACVEAVR